MLLNHALDLPELAGREAEVSSKGDGTSQNLAEESSRSR
jgi:hypothetical protein